MTKAAKSNFSKTASTGKIAVILTEPDSNPTVLKETIDHIKAYGQHELEILECTPENILKAAEKLRAGPREQGVCFIAGSSLGKDPEILERVDALGEAIINNGNYIVVPGSEGMMGQMVKKAMARNVPLTAVFSLAVAEANVEKLECAKFDRIVVAPNEDVRQMLYHLLSGLQIALPGGGGTKAEASAHFYKNTQIGLIYPRHLDGVINYPSPIIFFSPSTKMTQEAAKKILCERLYPGDPVMQKAIMDGPAPQGGFWAGDGAQYDMLVEMGFLKQEYRDSFIEVLRTPEEVVEMINNWSDPEVRKLMATTMNIHNNKTMQRYLNIRRSHELKPDKS